MYVLFSHLLSNSPEGPPFARYKRGTSSRLITRPGVFEIHGCRMTPTQFKCWFHSCIYYKSVTGSGHSRPPGGVGLTPRQYTVWNVEGRRSLYWRTLSVGAAACGALYCQRWEVYYQNLKLELSHKEPKQQTL